MSSLTEPSRVHRASATLSSQGLYSGLTLIVGLVATPAYLYLLGDERVGAFRALTDWGAYLTLLELGLSGALAACISRAASGSRAGLLAAVGAGMLAYRRVALAMVAGAAIIAAAAPWLIPVSESLRGELWIAAWLGLLVAALGWSAGVRPTLEALQRGYLVNAALILQSLMITALGLLLGWLGLGIPALALAHVAGAVAYVGALVWMLRTVDRELVEAVWRPQTTAEKRDEVQRLRRPTFITRIGGQLALLSDNILVAWMLGPAAVVPFFLTRRLLDIATGQIQSLGGASWAGLAELYHMGRLEVFRERVIELTRLTVVAAVALLGVIAIYNERFITLWIGGERYGGDPLTALAAVNGFLLAIFSLWSWLFGGTGKIASIAPVGVTASAVNVIVSVLATWRVGVTGPLIGTLCGFCFVSLWWLPFLMRREFGFSLRRLLAAVVSPVVIAAPVPLVAAIVMWATNHQPGWILLLTEMSATALITLGWSWLAVLAAHERALWRSRMPAMRNRRSKANDAP